MTQYDNVDRHIAAYEATLVRQGSHSMPKYILKDEENQRFFLKTYTTTQLSRMREVYNIMEQVYHAGVPSAKPVHAGEYTQGGGYILTEYEEEAIRQTAPLYTNALFRFYLGRESARAIKKLHGLPAKANICKEIYDGYISLVNKHKNLFEGLAAYIEEGVAYYDSCKHLLTERPVSLLHGDFNGIYKNMVICKDLQQKIVDWDEFAYGDPWWDLRWIAGVKPDSFIKGLLSAYFQGEPPAAFWSLLPLYMFLHNTKRFYKHPDTIRELVDDIEKRQHFITLLESGRLLFDNAVPLDTEFYASIVKKENDDAFVLLGLRRTGLYKPIKGLMMCVNAIRHRLRRK